MSATQVEPSVFDPAETMPRNELRALQLERLRTSIAHATNVPYYRETFAKAGLSADTIKSLDDLRRFPFTTKADLRENYPLKMLAVPRKDVIRFHGSSGTTGKPTFVAYTRDDLQMWTGLVSRFLWAGGVRPEHTVHIAFGYGLFTGGFGLHYGVENLGASVLPVASGNTRRQIMLLQDMESAVLVCTPSYALNIAEVCEELGIDPRSLPIKFGHFGGEMWTEDMRRAIEDVFDIQAFNNYGLSEVIGPGVSGDCMERRGMHVQEDHFIIECINPETLEPVAPGQPGELVFTSLTKQAMPIIRYRTRDIATLYDEPCPCGRTGVLMSRVTGRSDDMLIIRGVNVFPSQVEEALLRVEGTAPHYQIEITRPQNLDLVKVMVELRPEVFSDKMSQMQELRERIDREIQSVTGVRMHVDLVPPQTIERSTGKAKRVIDNRPKIEA